jgi:hypothetical protein
MYHMRLYLPPVIGFAISLPLSLHRRWTPFASVSWIHSVTHSNVTSFLSDYQNCPCYPTRDLHLANGTLDLLCPQHSVLILSLDSMFDSDFFPDICFSQDHGIWTRMSHRQLQAQFELDGNDTQSQAPCHRSLVSFNIITFSKHFRSDIKAKSQVQVA